MPSILDQLKTANATPGNGHGAAPVGATPRGCPLPEEPAARLVKPDSARSRSRRWDQEHPGVTLRLNPELVSRLRQLAADLMTDDTFRTNLSLVAEALLRRGLDTMEAQPIDVAGWESAPATRTPERIEP